MIRTATQLKAKVRNLSGGDSIKAQTMIRNFIMERFLERIALSQYRNNFILKGGMLVSAVVGLDTRATMDIDTTVKSLELSKENAATIVEEIITVGIPDGVHFTITKVTDIMARGTANTRMRDFYDIHVISQQEPFDPMILKRAFLATSSKRNTSDQIPDFRTILANVESDDIMRRQWENYQKESIELLKTYFLNLMFL